jgi:hypothetical protein
MHSQLLPSYSEIQGAFKKALPLLVSLSSQAVKLGQKDNSLSDDFESGNFDAWSGIYTTRNGSVSITTTQKFKGNYGAGLKVSNVTTKLENAQLHMILDQSTLIYARGYFYIDYGLSELLDEYDRFGLIVISSSKTDEVSLQIRRVNGQNRFSIGYFSGNNQRFASTTSVFPTDRTWYCMELAMLVNDTRGWVKAWVNGSPIIEVSGLNNTRYGDLVQVFWGLYAYNIGPNYRSWHLQAYGDEAAIANSYIGPDQE